LTDAADCVARTGDDADDNAKVAWGRLCVCLKEKYNIEKREVACGGYRHKSGHEAVFHFYLRSEKGRAGADTPEQTHAASRKGFLLR